MALCKDSFTGNMRNFNYDEEPGSWEDYLTRTSHVWSPEFSALLRSKGRKMARGERMRSQEKSYKEWTKVIVRNLLNYFEGSSNARDGDRLGDFEPLFQVDPLTEG